METTLRVNYSPGCGDSMRGYRMEQAADILQHRICNIDHIKSMATALAATRKVLLYVHQVAEGIQMENNSKEYVEAGRQLKVIAKVLDIAIKWLNRWSASNWVPSTGRGAYWGNCAKKR